MKSAKDYGFTARRVETPARLKPVTERTVAQVRNLAAKVIRQHIDVIVALKDK